MHRANPVAVLWLTTILVAVSGPSYAALTLELRPQSQVVVAGQQVEVALYAVADPPQPIGIITAILNWDPSDLIGIDNHGDGAYAWNQSLIALPPGGLDPADGHAYYFASVSSCDETAIAPPSGLKVTTFVFTATGNTGQTLVDILPSYDIFSTEVYDGLCDPKTEVLADIGPAVTVVVLSCGGDQDCGDDNSCTDDACVAGTCIHELNFPASSFCCDPATRNLTVLSDGNDCTEDECDSRTGNVTHSLEEYGTPCGDQSDTACTAPDTCDHFGGCLPNHAQNGNFCVNNCTEGPDTCSNGLCDSGGDNPCPPLDPARPFCQDRVVEGEACPNGDTDCPTELDFWCADGNGNPCATGGPDCVCRRPYVCVQCATTADCPDSGNCYNFACFPSGSCVLIVDDSYCQDGLLCNGKEWCELDMFVGYCRDDVFGPCEGEVCREETCCQDGICHELLCDCVECTVDAECDDGDPCTGVEVCVPNLYICMPGTPVDCSHLDDDCNVGVCNPATGLCESQVIAELIGVPNSCDDGEACTFEDACTAGGGCAGQPPMLDGSVDLQWDPDELDVQISAVLDTTIALDLYAVANDALDHGVGTIEAVIRWDPTVLELAPGTVPVDPCDGASELCRTCANTSIKRCTDDPTVACEIDGDCPGSDNYCRLFCMCTTDADCPEAGQACFCPGGPPCTDDAGLCVTGRYDWFGSSLPAGFLDPDGLNNTWFDGDAKYLAFAQQGLTAPVLSTEQLWVTTLEFTVIGGSTGSVVEFMVCSGENPTRTRVLGDGAANEITGSLGTITIRIEECQGDADCDDGVDCTTNACVDHVCVFTPDNQSCDDDVFCNGSESCDPAIGCVSGDEPCPGQVCIEAEERCVECLGDGDCEDGADCTVNTCVDETCVVEDICPDDGWFCTGVEFCDVPANMCKSTGDPCPGYCDEVNDRCPCEAPLVEAVGPRYLAITPQPESVSVPLSLYVTSPDWPCLGKYVGGFLECGDTGKRCRTNADCNECNEIAGACLTGEDCKLCTDGQTRCYTNQDCPGSHTCSIQYACLISGDTCDLQPLGMIDVNGDDLVDGVVATLVDDPANAASLTPLEWGTSLRRCSISLEPCAIDGDCDVGTCTFSGAVCSVLGQDCAMVCQSAHTECELDAHCPPGDTCSVPQTCARYEACESGRVYVTGEDILPSELDSTGGAPVLVPTRYEIWADCEGLVGPAEVTMPIWGDADRNVVVSFDDIQVAILSFEATWPISIPAQTLGAVDIVGATPCAVEQVVNFTDIAFFIFAFEGEDYNPDVLSNFDECDVPCP